MNQEDLNKLLKKNPVDSVSTAQVLEQPALTVEAKVVEFTDQEQVAQGKTIIEFSASTLDQFQKCEQNYKYSVVDRLEPHLKATPLDKGSLAHVILEQYYKEIITGKDKNSAHLEAIERGRDEAPKTQLIQSDIDQVISTFRRYHVKYQNDSWIPLGVEEPFYKPIYEDDNFIIVIRGKIDLRVEVLPHSKVSIVDHKTGDQNKKISPLSNQFEMYCIATGANEVVRNFIGWQKDPDLNFSRKPIPYSKEYLDEARKQLVYWGIRMYSAEIALGNKTYEPAMTKSNCIYCNFSDVCSSPPSGREFKLKDNYKVREKYELFEVKAK
jgi:hypothetical protein